MTDKTALTKKNDKGKQWVVKGNEFIECKFLNWRPSLVQNRILYFLVEKINSMMDKDVKTLEINAHQLRRVMNVNATKKEIIYELAILRSATAIMTRGEMWEAVGIIDTARFNTETEKIELKLNKEMLPYLMDFKKGGAGFTQIDYDCVMSMRSVHSQRIYELLIQYKYRERSNTRTFKLDELKGFLGLRIVNLKTRKVESEKLKRWSDFEKRVLAQAERDLCNAGLYIHYQPIKKGGNKIEEIEFTFSMQNGKDNKILEAFTKLQLQTIDDYDRIRIINSNSAKVVYKAIIEANNSGDIEPLKALIPKTRKEYRERMKKLFSEELELALEGKSEGVKKAIF